VSDADQSADDSGVPTSSGHSSRSAVHAHPITKKVAATHPTSGEATEEVQQYVSFGAAARAAIALAESARGHALIAGRPTVGFEDVQAVAPAALNHRVLLNYKARFDRVTAFDVIGGLIEAMDETAADLPDDVEVSGHA